MVAALQHVVCTVLTCPHSCLSFPVASALSLTGRRCSFPRVSASPQETWEAESTHSRQVRVKSSKNGSSFSSSIAEATYEVETAEEERVQEEHEEEEEGIGSVPLSVGPSCPVPNFATDATKVTLLNPLRLFSDATHDADGHQRPLLLYVPGMDCSGEGIRSQLAYLFNAGYDIRCVYIPSTDRSTWQQLVDVILPLMMEEVRVGTSNRHLTVLGESFGGGLAMRLAIAAPSLVTRLVLVNPATNFPKNNTVGSLAAQTGLLALFPDKLYEIAQDILLPLLVKRNRVSKISTSDYFSPMDFVPAACASWRLSMLNDNSGLSEKDLSSITMPTLLMTSAKDRILSSITEGARLQGILPNSKRVVLPESGHTALLEDSVNIGEIMLANGFSHPVLSNFSSNGKPLGPVEKREDVVADDVMDEMGAILRPWRILTSPLITGEENLPMPSSEPRRPLLFVGNHTMFGIYDSPLLVYELYLRGFRCRGLAHPGHWVVGAGPLFERYGNVKATKMAAYKLLKDGENILLFPGGAREVFKRKGEKYKLLWKETTDFVRMAARHKAIIIPFGALGGDDAYDILYDADDIFASPIGPLIKQVYSSAGVDPYNVYPITALPGTQLPSPFPAASIERIYFHFGKPIDTTEYVTDIKDRQQAHFLYGMVKHRVESSIELLKEIRSKDPERELAVRLMAKLGRLLPEFIPRQPLERR